MKHKIKCVKLLYPKDIAEFKENYTKVVIISLKNKIIKANSTVKNRIEK